MYLTELLAASRCIVPLEASTLADAGFALLGALETDGLILDSDALRERFEEARPEDVVGHRDRGFILHYRTDAVATLAIAVGVAAGPVCRELGDGDSNDKIQCARFVSLVVAPRRDSVRLIQVVKALGQILSKPSSVAMLEGSRDSEELLGSSVWRDVVVETQLTVRDLMSHNPLSVSPEMLLRSAVLDMRRAGVGALPVVDEENRVIGMMSEKELLHYLLNHYLPRSGGGLNSPPSSSVQPTVRDVMSRRVLCVSPHQPLAEVASLLLNKDVERVPVVQDGRLVGFLTRGDIARKFLGP